MKIGYIDYYIRQYGWEEGLRRMKEHGFETLHYTNLVSDSDPVRNLPVEEQTDLLKKQRQMIEAAGLRVEQTHGPWRCPPRDSTEAEQAERFATMSRSVECAAILGSPYIVIHPMMPSGVDGNENPDETFRMNVMYFRALAKVAEKNGVVICLENMPFPKFCLTTPEQIVALVKEIGSPFVRVCLDTGHAAVCGVSPADAVRQIGKDLLRVLHVHDNNGEGDFHWVPFFGVIDWAPFTEALNEIGFEGSVALESDMPRNIPDDLRPRMELVIADCAKRIAGQI